MKNNSSLKTKLSAVISTAGVVLLGLVLTFGLVACQNKKNKSNPIPPPGYYGGNYNYNGALCPTCNMNVAWTIFAGTDSQSGSGAVSLGLDFYGDPMTGANFYDPKIPLMYNGPVVVRGMLTVNTVDSLICSIPVGQYQITSLSAGQWQSGVVSGGYSNYGPSNLYMEARSMQYGTSVIMRLAKGIIYNQTGTNSWTINRLGGTLVFEAVNSMPCRTYSGQAAYTELY